MRCDFKKANGARCRANAMARSSYCFLHNPEVEEEKKLAILKGGYSPKQSEKPLPPVEIKKVDDILALIEDTINRVRTEPMTHQKANCIGYLANIALKVFETSELGEKIDKINQLILNRK